MSAELIGMVELDRGLAKLLSTVEGLKTSSIDRAAEVLADSWREVILPHSHTYNYYFHIDKRITGPGKAEVFNDAVRSVRANAPAPYPRYVEFGTRKMAPRGYGRQAFVMGEEGAASAAGGVLGAGIQMAFPE